MQALKTTLLLATLTITTHAQTIPNLTGTWHQDNTHSTPTRSGDVTLRIDHHDPNLTVETTRLPKQHAIQRYTTDGHESVTTGADGDTFHTKIVRQDQSLLFTITEHEDGHAIDTTETWTLSPDGNTLTRLRHSSKFKSDQTILYTRIP